MHNRNEFNTGMSTNVHVSVTIKNNIYTEKGQFFGPKIILVKIKTNFGDSELGGLIK